MLTNHKCTLRLKSDFGRVGNVSVMVLGQAVFKYGAGQHLSAISMLGQEIFVAASQEV